MAIHEVRRVETNELKGLQPLWVRVYCTCGHVGQWYRNEALARELHLVHVRAASARDASDRRERLATGSWQR